jgi:hypothetical protein
VAAAAAFDVGQRGLSHGKPSASASASARNDLRVAGRMFDLSASASSSSSTFIFGRRVPWWVRPAATTAGVVCGVYAARWLLRALLPRVISGALQRQSSKIET